MKILFRTDASTLLASGHVMRCATLAEALRQQQVEVAFVCHETPGHMIDWLRARNFNVYALPSSLPTDEVDSVIKIIGSQGPFDWLIVDHYHLNAEWERKLKPHVGRLMVIDDLADRLHDCHLLLDQNYYEQPENRYKSLIPDDCSLLLGPAFSLLRPDFKEWRDKLPSKKQAVERIFIFFGGCDPTGETLKALKAFEILSMPHLKLDVVVGSENPHRDAIYERCKKIPQATYYSQVDNIAELMSQADLAIGAGGTTTWERLVLGLPTIALAIADNQMGLSYQVALDGHGVFLGPAQEISAKALSRHLFSLIENPCLRQHFSRSGMKLVDGNGTKRVINRLVRPSYRISVLSDANSWINDSLSDPIKQWQSEGHTVHWVHKVSELAKGDFAFFLSCSQIVPTESLQKHKHNLVVHESALPQGKGWSPLTWQILEGKKEIPITLLEAQDKVDSGPIYLQETIHVSGTELVDELRNRQAEATYALCHRFIREYPGIVQRCRRQEGEESFYPRRRPQDSRLDPDKTIREQFNLLRVVDNERYPAYFEVNGKTYALGIIRESENPPSTEVKTGASKCPT